MSDRGQRPGIDVQLRIHFHLLIKPITLSYKYGKIALHNKSFTQLHNGSQVNHILSDLHLTSTNLQL